MNLYAKTKKIKFYEFKKSTSEGYPTLQVFGAEMVAVANRKNGKGTWHIILDGELVTQAKGETEARKVLVGNAKSLDILPTGEMEVEI